MPLLSPERPAHLVSGMADEVAEADIPDPATLIAFLVLVLFAGGNAVAIRFTSCEACELDPFWGAAMRFLVASLILAAVAAVSRVVWPRGKALRGAILYGALQFGAGFGLVYWGLVRAPAGLGQLLLASVPLITFVLALARGQERYRWEGLAGAALAVTGIAVVFTTGTDAGVPLISMLALLGGAVCWATAFVVVRASPQVHPAAMNAVAMGVGTAILLSLTLIFRESYVIPTESSTWAAQAYLVLAGSIGVFCLYVFVLKGWTASAASYQLVLIPLVTIALSAWLHDEKITWTFAAGSVLVLLGVYVGALRRRTA